ncbi:Catabolite repressor/activator [Arsenophonus endosymbiont of Bemisia tabaci Q2]|nr:Catabolite repressor/activator [Arsenophonus endosymbiont of Bemisia tabaci Q2]
MKLDEIARLAGVSRTTASYVINGKAKQYRVSDKTVERAISVVKEYNYYPNAVAAGLRAGRTHLIALVIPDLENTSYTQIANYLERKEVNVGISYSLPALRINQITKLGVSSTD